MEKDDMGSDLPRPPGTGAPAETHELVGACKDQLWAFAQQSLHHAILLLDPAGIVRWANPGAAEILAIPSAELAGSTTDRLFVPEDRDIGIPAQELAVASSRGSGEDDRWMLRGNGSRFWASGMMVALRDAGGSVTGFVKILRDQTDLKMQLVTLRNRVSALDATEDERRRAMALLSHELRNPLATMGMASAMLRKQAEPEDSRMQLPLGMLDRNIAFAARLMDDLDDVGRISEGKFDLQITRVSARELLQSAISAACERFGGDRHGGIDLLLPAADVTVDGDSMRLQQVFVNLIGNAIKFTPPSERIWVTPTTEGTQMVVRVADAGIGIAPDRLEHIFDMFTQVHHPKASRGLGIGLAVVKNLVELHGGTVQVRSEGVGKGSTFTVRLPLQQPKRDDAGTDVSSRPA